MYTVLYAVYVSRPMRIGHMGTLKLYYLHFQAFISTNVMLCYGHVAYSFVY